MIRRFLSISGLLFVATAITACGGVDSDESQPIVSEPDQGQFVATWSPATAQVPFPNDIYFSGSLDGTLNIPASPANPALSALNSLDGYSTTASIYVDTTDSIASASLVYGATVFLINTNTLTPVPATVSRGQFNNGTATIEIVPAAPLDGGTTYAGLVTQSVQSTVGDALAPDEGFAGMQALYAAGVTPGTVNTGDPQTDALFGAIYPLLQLADGAGIGAANLAVAFSFKTQSIGASLADIDGSATAQTNGFIPVPANGVNYDNGILDTADANPALQGKADIYVGLMEVPYYSDAANPLSGYWQADGAACLVALPATPESTTGGCPTPTVNATLSIPVILTVPNASSNLGGAIAGVTIFQHGITRNRTDMLAIADAMADAGRAVIAIDQPLHGIVDTTSPFFGSPQNPLYQNAANASGDPTLDDALTELHFNLDIDGTAGIDASGSYFINLESLLTTRDNQRQAVTNLIHLVRTIPTIDYNVALDGGASGADFTGLPVSFVGQSLGGINGTTFLAVNTDTEEGVLSVPGGVLTQLLTQSNTFADPINNGLAENGVVAGTRFYEEFLRNAQTAVDAGDPINYAAAANANHPILMHMVITGGVAGGSGDQVVPNSATEALAAAMGLTQVTTDTVGTDVDGLVKFLEGSHGSLLDPSASPAATVEMQTQMATFIGSGGNFIDITNGSVVDQ